MYNLTEQTTATQRHANAHTPQTTPTPYTENALSFPYFTPTHPHTRTPTHPHPQTHPRTHTHEIQWLRWSKMQGANKHMMWATTRANMCIHLQIHDRTTDDRHTRAHHTCLRESPTSEHCSSCPSADHSADCAALFQDRQVKMADAFPLYNIGSLQ